MGILNKITNKKEEESKKDNVLNSKKDSESIKNLKVKKEDKKKMVSKVKKVSKDKIPNHYFELIKRPHISEKTFNLSNANQYVFIISKKANKSEIKKVVRSLYGVQVVGVNIVNVPSKPKKFKGRPGIKSGYKKAIVTLAKGNTIDLMKESK